MTNSRGEQQGSLLVELRSILEPLRPDAWFATPGPLDIELGCGDGSFLLQYASRHPERRFLGVERLMGRIRKIDRKGRRLGLRNLRGLRIEAGYCLEYLLPPSCAHALHVYFPDPWPKAKHKARRMIRQGFPELVERVLVAGGSVYLRTDADEYFAQMTEVFERSEMFFADETPESLLSVPTDFETEFRAAGRSVHYLAYRRR